ncbi:transposase [Pseudothauera rhizosphaerae]|uniref:Transposase n=1 Tax=Pseudothauera rhizosphaerae TaxID=2565932 RepID=A0A4S4ABA0_9RHOO|nr:transposase [Pseudothauera rhizosphaerae]
MSMKQLTFASAAYSAKKKTTNQKTGPKGGRPPIDLAKMLRVWCLQQWFALSDPGMGKAFFNRVAAKVRSRIEHPFRVLKRQFGYIKVRYHGLAKNSSQIVGLFALINLYIARRQLMPQGV